jgi:hypothetical protein
MKSPKDKNWLDEALAEAIGSEKSEPDFEKWKRNHPEAVEMLTSRAPLEASPAGEATDTRSTSLTGRAGRKPPATAGPLSIRSIIMKSRITKLATAAAIIVAVLIGFYFAGSPFAATVTFAQVIQPILNARTVVFDFIVGEDQTGPLIHQIVVGSRIRQTISNLPNTTSIIDLESAKILALDTEAKTAVYVDIKGSLEERTRNYIEFVRKVLMKLKDSPNVEKIGEQEIDGQKVIGFVARGPNEEVKIWADPHTAVPIRVELRLGLLFVIMKNFKFDVPVDDSLVSMDVPPGYTLEQTDVDFSGATEQDFVESLRIWADVLMGGEFPEAIGTENTMKQVPLLAEKLAPLDLSDDEKRQLGMKFIRGMLFLQIYEAGDEWHYAGSGVKLGDVDTPVFWYQPKGSDTYRVIYADLSVKDVAPADLPK